MASEDFSESIGAKISKPKKAKLKKRAKIEGKNESDVVREAVDKHMLGWDEDIANSIKTENKVHIFQGQEPSSNVKKDGTFYFKGFMPAKGKISNMKAEGFGCLVGALMVLSFLVKK